MQVELSSNSKEKVIQELALKRCFWGHREVTYLSVQLMAGMTVHLPIITNAYWFLFFLMGDGERQCQSDSILGQSPLG